MQYINYDINSFLPKGQYLIFALVCKEWRDYLKSTDMNYITYYSAACQSVEMISELRVPRLSHEFYKLADFDSSANREVIEYAVDNNFDINGCNCLKIVSLGNLELNKKIIREDNFYDRIIGAAINARDVESVVWMFREFVKTVDNPIITESRLIEICSLFYTMDCVHYMNELHIPINSGVLDAYAVIDPRLIDILLFHRYIVPDVNLAARLAVAGDLEGMYRMFDVRDDRSSDFSGEYLTVEAGVLEYLQLLQESNLPIHIESWEIAIANNHLHIVSWLIAEEYVIPENVLCVAVEQDFAMFKLIIDNYPFERDQIFDYYAYLDVEKAEYIYKKGLMWRGDVLFDAFYNKDKNIVDWLIAKGADMSDCLVEGHPITYAAAVNGNLRFLKMYFCINSKFPDSIVAVVVEGGYLQIVKWLATIGYDMQESDMHIAAGRGHLHIMKWYFGTKRLSLSLLHQKI